MQARWFMYRFLDAMRALFRLINEIVEPDEPRAEERGQQAMVAKNTLAQLSQPGGEALTGFYFDACAGTVTTIHPLFSRPALPPLLQRAQCYLLVVGRFLPHESPSRFYSLLHAFLPFDTQVRNLAAQLALVPGLEEQLAQAGLTVHPPEDAYWARELDAGRTADVCPAAIDNYRFIIKYCLERSAEDDYWGEDKIYSCIAEKAPWLAPFFVGLFTRHDPVDGSRLALVVERWGQSLKSFDLEKDERLAIFKLLEQLHTVIGVIHGAFRPDNVVVDSGSRVFKLIDFGRSTWHDCPGTTTCEELAYARFDLKLHGD
ncbi:hypothetical protein Rhopal_005810-T1 [Rhodotorula paludigena]|uniref:Aminoglycoside phosphotransferase domain-containing protein n=1 Tax=Rhodotorula paludigena TaxID=86838 RepID=A0AAV5GTS1_9BASI|nr:hypothetical protein Rhopal_005810-T1 [Rhodotorula paludigena]